MGLRVFFNLPPSKSASGKSPCPDLLHRELHLTGADGTEVTVLVEPEVLEAEYIFERVPGATGSVYLVDVDTSGNRSAPSNVVSFPLDKDTTPPATPGELSVVRVEEVD